MVERISWQDRYFVPTGANGGAVLAKMLKNIGANAVSVGGPATQESRESPRGWAEVEPDAPITDADLKPFAGLAALKDRLTPPKDGE